MSTPKTEQVLGDRLLASRLVGPWTTIVVLERIARGAGSTRWYLARSEDDFVSIAKVLLGGSRVSFYFDEQLVVAVDSETERLEMFDATVGPSKILVGFPLFGEIGFTVELTSGSNELAEELMKHPEGGTVIWGPWPQQKAEPGRSPSTLSTPMESSEAIPTREGGIPLSLQLELVEVGPLP